MKKELPSEYELILVDGPTGSIGRGGFYTYLDLFKTNITIIFDDVEREAEYQLMIRVAQKLNRDFKIFAGNDPIKKKNFGVLMPK